MPLPSMRLRLPEADSVDCSWRTASANRAVGFDMRIGLGYDIHRLAEKRPLILGGVPVPYEKGLLGHSDADVLLHAVIDALLGAARLGDIGVWFPDTDGAYEGIDSRTLLEQIWRKVTAANWRLGNLDAVVMAERPKLRPFIPRMETAIAHVLGVSADRISIKATTAERLGFVGREEGIAAQAVVLLKPL